MLLMRYVKVAGVVRHAVKQENIVPVPILSNNVSLICQSWKVRVRHKKIHG